MLKKKWYILVFFVCLLRWGVYTSEVSAEPWQIQQTPTITSTATTIVTATPTIEPSPTFTPTPDLLTADEVEDILNENFDEIKSLIQELDEPEIVTSTNNIRDNLISSMIWAILGLVFGSFFWLIKRIIKRYRKRNLGESELLDEVLDELNVAVNFMLVIILLAFTFLTLFSMFLGGLNFFDKSVASVTPNNRELSDQLVRMETKIDSVLLEQQTNISTPTPQIYDNIQIPQSASYNEAPVNYQELVLAACVFGVLNILVLVVSRYGLKVQKGLQISSAEISLDAFHDERLHISLILALLLLLLPYPADSLIMPFLLNIFLFAFFDLVNLIPSLKVKTFVSKFYLLIIFFASLGVWTSFVGVISRYFFDLLGSCSWVLDRISSLSEFDVSTSSDFLTQFKEIHLEPVYFISALLWTLSDSVFLGKAIKRNAIPKIRGSIRNLEEDLGS